MIQIEHHGSVAMIDNPAPLGHMEIIFGRNSWRENLEFQGCFLPLAVSIYGPRAIYVRLLGSVRRSEGLRASEKTPYHSRTSFSDRYRTQFYQSILRKRHRLHSLCSLLCCAAPYEAKPFPSPLPLRWQTSAKENRAWQEAREFAFNNDLKAEPPPPLQKLRLMKVGLKIGMTKTTAAYERWISELEGTSASDAGDKRRSIFFATIRRKRTTTLRYFRLSAPALTHCSSHTSARKGISHSVLTISCRVFGSASGPIFSMLAINRAAANSSKTKCLAWYIKPSNVNAFAISSATAVILQPFLGPTQRCHARVSEAIALPAPAPRVAA